MNRKDGWPEILTAFLLSRERSPFVWGQNDCCLFACDGILLLTGTDLAAGIRGRYKTRIGAQRVIRRMGGTVETLAAEVCSRYGIPEIPVAMAGRGCVVVLDTPDGPAAGLCTGSMVAFPGPTGLSFVPLMRCRRAWRV